MPTVELGGASVSDLEISGRLTIPVYLFGESETGLDALAAFRAVREFSGVSVSEMEVLGDLRIVPSFTGDVEIDLEATGSLGIARAFSGMSEWELEAAATAGRVASELAGGVEADLEATGGLRVPAFFRGASEWELEVGASIGFAFPELSDPLAGELAGVVNLFVNPSFESGLDGASPSGSVIVQVADGTAWTGDAHLLWTIPAGSFGSLTLFSLDHLSVDAEDGESWLSVARVRAPVGVSVEGHLGFWYEDGSYSELTSPVDPIVFDGDAAWQPMLVGGARAGDLPLRRLQLVLSFDNQTVDPVDVSVDGVQLARLGPGSETYADGDQGAGHAWLGVPHNSPSVRQPGVA